MEAARTPAVGVVVYHHVNELELAAVLAVFGAAERLGLEGPAAETVARSRASLQSSGGLTFTPARAFTGCPRYQALFLPGGPGVDAAMRDRAMRAFLEQAGSWQPLLAASGSGVLLLGALGTLRNLSLAAHPELRERLLDFEPGELLDAPLVRAEGLWTARDAAAAADLALAVLGQFCGREAARQTAAFLGLASLDGAG